jgi:hypothetical protein
MVHVFSTNLVKVEKFNQHDFHSNYFGDGGIICVRVVKLREAKSVPRARVLS